MVIEKSANQLWRESGTTLSFKDWLSREKKKYEGGARTTIMINKPLNDTIEQTLSFSGNPKPGKMNRLGSTLGVSNVIWVVAAVAVGGIIVYQIIKKKL